MTVVACFLAVQIRTTEAFSHIAVRNSFAPPPFRRCHSRLFHAMSGGGRHHRVPEHVLIAGAGVIGISTAYYLQKNHDIQSITLIDPTGTIAPAASGKAGGFLALDWNDRTFTEQLTRRSFALHQELAIDLTASTIQYRRLTCAAVSVNPYDNVIPRRPAGKKLQNIEWAQPENMEQNAVLGMQPMGDTDTIAQVHPKKLCQRMWEKIRQEVPHAKIIKGTVKGAVHSQEDGRLLGARLLDDEDDSLIEGDALLFACGPWTADFLQGVKYHSVVVPTKTVLSQCVFFSGCGDPEVYVRPDSTAYCTGFPEPPRTVTERPGHETVLPDKIVTILESVRDACGHKMDQEDLPTTTTTITTAAASTVAEDKDRPSWALQITKPVVEQACYLPTTYDNVPVMGQIPVDICGGAGCYIATGHGCWGILLGPATGESMSSLIMTGTGTSHVSLAPFQPRRFGVFKLVP